ncbi:MAG: hypothetical protein A2Y18_02060 [Clostridiales bacterium GWD2_32_19]|nr:MAG: hypothetical protein A2Y18_02060 [Clostridiales bacterium GWD2_32_19]
MKYNFKKLFKYILLLIIFSLVFVGCNNDGKTNKQDKEKSTSKTNVSKIGGELIIGTKAPETFNPLLNIDEDTDQVLKLIYDTLVNIDENIKPVPNIAESWKVNDIGTAVNIKLRNDVIWHDGQKLTAEDVIYSMDTIRNATASLYKKNLRNVMSYAVIDEYNLKIVYNKPAADIPYTLCFPIIPKHYYDTKEVVINPLGSGRYKFTSYEAQKQIILELNEKYINNAGYIKKITAKIMKDKTVEEEAFKQNQIDFIYTDKLNMQKYASDKKSRQFTSLTMYYDFVGFNFNNQYLKDKKMRQAVAYSINKNEYLDKYYLGFADIADTPVHPKSWLYLKDVVKYNYDKGRAEKLVTEVLKDKKDKVKLRLLVNEENYQRMNIANSLKSELDSIGFDVVVEKYKIDEYMQKVDAGNFDILLGGWKFSKFQDFTFMFNSEEADVGKNYGGYKDAQTDLLLEKTFLSFQEEDMRVAYKELQKHIHDELPYVSIAFRKNIIYTNPKLKGELKPLEWNIFNNIEECSIDVIK